MLRNILTGFALLAGAATALPSVALAKDHGHKHGHYKHGHKHGKHQYRYDDRGARHYGANRYYGEGRPYRANYAQPRYYAGRTTYRCEKTGGTTGLILGGAAGALLGRAIDTRGDRAMGTLVGAGAGALLGRELTQKRRC